MAINTGIKQPTAGRNRKDYFNTLAGEIIPLPTDGTAAHVPMRSSRSVARCRDFAALPPFAGHPPIGPLNAIGKPRDPNCVSKRQDQWEQRRGLAGFAPVPPGVATAMTDTAMTTATIEQRPDVETLAAVIARSQIVVARVVARSRMSRRLPAGFDEADVAILDWIAAEGRRVRRLWM